MWSNIQPTEIPFIHGEPQCLPMAQVKPRLVSWPTIFGLPSTAYHHQHQNMGSVTRIIIWLPEMKLAQNHSVGNEAGIWGKCICPFDLTKRNRSATSCVLICRDHVQRARCRDLRTIWKEPCTGFESGRIGGYWGWAARFFFMSRNMEPDQLVVPAGPVRTKFRQILSHFSLIYIK